MITPWCNQSSIICIDATSKAFSTTRTQVSRSPNILQIINDCLSGVMERLRYRCAPYSLDFQAERQPDCFPRSLKFSGYFSNKVPPRFTGPR